ncbi:RNA helicase, DEAD-box type, Q motif [Sesbania bispinosa]|nr:RNA helicase, DEAD-box type, Q motif [Sesbania bispinosa]
MQDLFQDLIVEQANASAAADEDILAVASQSELPQPPSPPVIQDPPLTQKIQDARTDKNNWIAVVRTADSTVNSDRSFSSCSNNGGNPLEGGALSPAAQHHPSPAALHPRPCPVSVSPSTSSYLRSRQRSLQQSLPPLLKNTFSCYAGVKSFVHLPLSNRIKDGLQEGKFVSMTDIQRASKFNDYRHGHHPPIAFIKTEVRGLFGSMFCDFALEFTIFAVNGKLKKAKDVRGISWEEEDLYEQKLFAKIPQNDANIFLFFSHYSFVSFNSFSWFQVDIG